jgi:AraC-like DNA-binding protein
MPTPPDPWLRTTEPLLWLGGAGHEVRTDASYFYDCRHRHDRPHLVLQYTIGGTGFYQDRRGRSLLPAGCAFFSLIPGDFQYGFEPKSDRAYELVFVSFVGPEAMTWYRRLTGAFGHVMNLGTEERIGPLMLALAHARETNRLSDRYVQSAQIYQLLMELYSTLNRTRLSTSPRVTQAMRLIADHAAEASFGVQQLAAEMDCSREHLTRLFRAAIGVNPSDYLTQQRLRLAAEALRATDDKLETIARRCGFSNANYFCRSFRQHVGSTPARFRKQPWVAGP